MFKMKAFVLFECNWPKIGKVIIKPIDWVMHNNRNSK